MLSCSRFSHGSTRLLAILVLLALLIPVSQIQNLVLPTLAHAPFVQGGGVNVKINFQPDSSPVPSGYTKDIGAAYDSSRGSGWVREDSLSSATHVPLNIVPNSRDRNLNTDQRLDTLLHMQFPPTVNNATAVKIPAAWEYDLANGTYTVTVAVGDPQVNTDAHHFIHVEGVLTINNFVPTGPAGSITRHAIATVTVPVSDGKLTIDAIGGTNTKINYVDIDLTTPDTTPPAAPSNVVATAGDSQVVLTWNANTEPDLVGYNVYRSTTATVDTTGTPLNGGVLTTTNFTDTSVSNGTTYYYVVQAVDTSGNKGDSAPVSATPDIDSTPPAPPGNVTATAGNAQVVLTWNANTESDLAGYNLFRGLTSDVDTTGPPLNAALLRSNSYTDTTVTNGTTYYYVVQAVDLRGNKANAASVSATPEVPQTTVNIKVNFQSANAPVPAGYLRDFGEPYGLRTGANQGTGLIYGWETPRTNTPVSLVGNGRDRNVNGDQRLDTFMHMQYTGSPTSGVVAPGAWEIEVPNGAYTVTVNVGDAGPAVDSVHEINLEGQVAVTGFVPTAATKFFNTTRTVNVTDSRLTVDAEGGTNTKINYIEILSASASANRPSVTSSTPTNGETNVARDAFVSAEVNLPNVGYGIDDSTLTAATVKLIRSSDSTQVPANFNTSGGGDVIVLQPTVLLDANSNYIFAVTNGLKDLSGAEFIPYTISFTTGTSGGNGGSGVTFEKVVLPTAIGKSFTSVTFGPDGKLYAGTLDGEIVRFSLNPDGTVGTPEVISSLQNAEGGPRLLIGVAFDPSSTASNLILWTTHTFFAFNNAPDWAGKITRLSGPNLETVQDYVVNLPRSIRDHVTNSIAFGPDGALYFTQGSNSAMGAPDNAWGLRPEHLLNAAVLRLNPAAITSPPLDVKTEDGGTYDPFAAGAPLTIYASGVRNAYDLVWHSNGSLYVPTNGSAAGGQTPSTPATLPSACQQRIDDATNGDYTGPQVTGIANVTVPQHDFLFRVVQGGYYGHPNPQRCEWVMNGGNPTAGSDPAQVAEYSVGTLPDRNWRGFAFDFGTHYSPNGVIEYHSNIFGGALAGKLLVVRYSGGDDIIVLTPGGPNQDIVGSQVNTVGFTGFQDPLDLVENPANGYLYVTELDGQKITLLRPVAGTGIPNIAASPSQLTYNDVQNGTPSAAQTVTINNTGDGPLSISALSITGTNANQFQLSSQPTFPITIQPASSTTLGVVFNPTSAGPKKASLLIQSNDPDTPQTQVALRGLGSLGTGGTNEPSLQWILDTFDIPVNVGDPDPTNSSLPTDPLLGEEVSLQRFQKANSNLPVTLQPIAVFGPSTNNPTVRFGWYTSGNAASKQELFTVSNAFAQSLNPPINGVTSFDPGNANFGFYSIWPFFSNREIFSQDSLNTFTGAIPHHVRVYPLKDTNGVVVPNSYIVTTEENTSGFDYQDIVVIVRNVQPAAVGIGGEIAKINFQPDTTAIPAGYIMDAGQAYGVARGFGWVVPGTSTPVSKVLDTRLRTAPSDQRLKTLIIMQGNAVTTGAWEYALPNGSYQVTVSVGDATNFTGNYKINVEGINVINSFVPSSAAPFKLVTTTVQVSDGRLTIDSNGGSETKLNYVEILNAGVDVTAPNVAIQLTGATQSPDVYKNKVTVSIVVSDFGGSGPANTAYSLNNSPYQTYSGPFDITSVGSYTITASASDGAGNTSTTPVQSFSIVSAPPSHAEIEVQNLDGVPFADRLVFNRIGSLVNPPSNSVHDQATLRIKNTGSDPLQIIGLSITGPWILDPAVSLPQVIAVGSQLDVKLRFQGVVTGSNNGTISGSLTVSSDDADEPTTVIALSGLWQSVPEGGVENGLPKTIMAFGYATIINRPGQPINQKGLVRAIGEEVLSPYWQRANPTQPVSVRQLSAFHTQGNTATVYWHNKGSNTVTAIVTHSPLDAQSILPRKSGGATVPAQATFTPGTTFGFRIDGSEWSDPTKNAQTVDQNHGCPGPCGHHVRFWPVRDRQGKLVFNTWLMAMDYAGINYDYNDNVYLISNIKPEDPLLNPTTAAVPGTPTLALDFNQAYPGTLLDTDGQTSGFTSTQRNKLDTTNGSNSYQNALLNVDASGNGTLSITTAAGSNGTNDNTQVNGLQVNFDATAGNFVVSTRLLGPLAMLTTGSQQGGVMFGPDQDNFMKLVAIAKNGAPVIQFYLEQSGAGSTVGGSNANVPIANPATIQSLDLMLLANPATGVVRAAYRAIYPGSDTGLVVLPNSVTLTGDQVYRFCGPSTNAGLVTSHKGATQITLVFDRFAVTAGDPTAAPDQRQVIYRLDVAGSANYTDTQGNVWQPDTGFFSPSSAIAEGATVQPQEIANTNDDLLYRTYRGNVGNVPLDQRVLTYNLPITGTQTVDLRLHFAERAHNTIGARLFDIEAEGTLLRDDFDIFAAAGGANTAVVLPFTNVQVLDGQLTLVFRTALDFASIAAIEVLCPGTCSSVSTAPMAVSSLETTASPADLDKGSNGKQITPRNTAAALDAKINFQPDTSPIPSGYTKDIGEAYDNTLGRGWVREDSLSSASHLPLSIVPNSRDRNLNSDQRLDTFLHMQFPPTVNNATAVKIPAAWEFALPSGTYTVTVAVGDATVNDDSIHVVNVEGVRTIDSFVPSGAAGSNTRHATAIVMVPVRDGKLTIDTIGGTNTKLDYVDITGTPDNSDITPPAAPNGLTANELSSAGVVLDWNDNTETDLAGYNVYRSSNLVGPLTKLNAGLLSSSNYPDSTAPASQTSYYEITAFDAAGNESAPATISVDVPGVANFTTITWTKGAASPVGRNEALGAAVNGKLYVFGGYAGDPNNTPTRRADVYNPTSNAWSRISDLPVGISHAGVAEDGQNIYYAGGYPARTGGGQTFATKTVWSYNTNTDTYISMPALPQARGGGALVLLGRNLHFFGGSDSSRLDSNSHWYLSLDNLQQGWTTAAPLPKAVNHIGSAVLGGKIYAVGGQTGQNESAIAQSSVYVWNPETNTWTAVKSLPTTRSHIAAATFVMGSRIIVAGGEPVPGSTTKKVTAFEPLSNSWTELSPLPLARKSGVARAIGNLIVYTTGVTTTTTFRGVPVN